MHRTTDQLRTTTSALGKHQRSTVDSGEKSFTLSHRDGQIWRSRGRRFKSRQPDKHDVGSSRLITAGTIWAPAILNQPQCRGVGPRLGRTSASALLRRRGRPGGPDADNGSSRPGLDGQHTLQKVQLDAGTATNSAIVAQAARLQQIVGHQPRLRERQQVPTRKHIGLDAEPVTRDPALQADREETVVMAG